jgi:hypothetical protein
VAVGRERGLRNDIRCCCSGCHGPHLLSECVLPLTPPASIGRLEEGSPLLAKRNLAFRRLLRATFAPDLHGLRSSLPQVRAVFGCLTAPATTTTPATTTAEGPSAVIGNEALRGAKEAPTRSLHLPMLTLETQEGVAGR